jgi:rhodanese-related sulfurtransferase
MTAHWLKQMGWDVCVLDHAFAGATLEHGPVELQSPLLPAAAVVSAEAAAALIDAGAASIAIGSSAAFRAAHPPGAVWTTRARLGRLPARVRGATKIVIFAEDPTAARLLLPELAELGSAELAVVSGGVEAWRRAGYPVVATPNDAPDSERIDFIFWNHNRHETDEGAAQAMRNYLQWELDLPAEIEKDGLSGFRLGAA